MREIKQLAIISPLASRCLPFSKSLWTLRARKGQLLADGCLAGSVEHRLSVRFELARACSQAMELCRPCAVGDEQCEGCSGCTCACAKRPPMAEFLGWVKMRVDTSLAFWTRLSGQSAPVKKERLMRS